MWIEIIGNLFEGEEIRWLVESARYDGLQTDKQRKLAWMLFVGGAVRV